MAEIAEELPRRFSAEHVHRLNEECARYRTQGKAARARIEELDAEFELLQSESKLQREALTKRAETLE